MLLFLQILFTMFIAEMGDKTQLLMIAMTSRYKLRDIIIGSGASILALNAIAVGLGALISRFIPTWLIKIIAALAFFYFAWTTLCKVEDGEEEQVKESKFPPILTVFGTFFIAELGDKTQLTAITFAANEGVNNAILVWLACSIGLFAADLIGMLVGHLIESKMPAGFLDKLAFVIFAVFGFTTMEDGVCLLTAGWISWAVAGCAAALFAVLCVCTWKKHQKVCQSE
ncbi:MAG: TMEM165/GDT1 family protein [Lachnospiraceae bacterium]|nr:TMEM165/GDT1 family protein [Lachnospiraceae bacterium]